MKRVLVLVSLLSLTACGSGDDNTLSAKDDYLIKAEAVCAKANSDQKALKTPTGSGELSAYVDAVVKVAETSTTALSALTPPDKDKAALQEHVLGPLQGQLVKAKAYADAVRKATKDNDNIALIKLFGDPPTKTVADLAWMRSYGFRECVDAADTSG